MRKTLKTRNTEQVRYRVYFDDMRTGKRRIKTYDTWESDLRAGLDEILDQHCREEGSLAEEYVIKIIIDN
jgi:hypothetical protein